MAISAGYRIPNPRPRTLVSKESGSIRPPSNFLTHDQDAVDQSAMALSSLGPDAVRKLIRSYHADAANG
jgi:hypothetical protein